MVKKISLIVSSLFILIMITIFIEDRKNGYPKVDKVALDLEAGHTSTSMSLNKIEPMRVALESNIDDSNDPLKNISDSGNDLLDEFQYITKNLNIETMSLEGLEALDISITQFFDDKEIVKKINNDEIAEADRASLTIFFDYITEVRSRAISKRIESLQEDMDVLKNDIASGDQRQPEPLSDDRLLEIDQQISDSYEEKMEALRQQRVSEDQASLKDDLAFQ